MKKKISLLLVVLMMTGLSLAGCGHGDDNGEGTGPDDAAGARNEIVIAIGAEPESLDPIAMASAPAATVSEHVSQPLIYLDVDGEIKPGIVASWEVSDDDLAWTLNLREDVTFHDGTPFNAAAVKVNLDRFMAEESAAPFAFLIERIIEVEAADEFTVKLHLEEPFAPMLSHLTHSFIGMLSPATLEGLAVGETTEEPVGTGPYKFVQWDRGEQIIMERNDNYWGDLPEIERVVFKFVPEDAARVVMLETGEADAIMRVPPSDMERLQAIEDIDIITETSVRLIYIGFNCEMEPFDDPLVRQAANYAVDKQAIVDTILEGSGAPSSAPIVPAVFGYDRVGPYEYDPDRARELLADAGYPDGFETTLYHPTGRYLMDATISEAVQSMLADVGINATLETMEWGTYLDYMQTKTAEEATHPMYMLGWGTVTLDADYGLYPMFLTDEWAPDGWNVSYYSNPEVDDLLETARKNPDRDERERMYAQANALIWEDAPWLFLHDEIQINGVRSDVQGLIHHPLENLFVWEARFK